MIHHPIPDRKSSIVNRKSTYAIMLFLGLLLALALSGWLRPLYFAAETELRLARQPIPLSASASLPAIA